MSFAAVAIALHWCSSTATASEALILREVERRLELGCPSRALAVTNCCSALSKSKVAALCELASIDTLAHASTSLCSTRHCRHPFARRPAPESHVCNSTAQRKFDVTRGSIRQRKADHSPRGCSVRGALKDAQPAETHAPKHGSIASAGGAAGARTDTKTSSHTKSRRRPPHE